jgi:hypothetical protein
MYRTWISCYLILLLGCEKMSAKNFNIINSRKLSGNEVYLVVFNGESNSGGFADNADLTAGELASRSGVQIWNNTSSAFQNLDIGTNNLISHTGLSDNVTHGWENGLCIGVETGQLPNPVYLVKTGQGGSIITEWNVGGSYWNTMTGRIDAAISAIEGLGKTPVIVVWYTIGINDRIAGTNEATWRTNVEAFISNFRTEYGASIPFIMPYFMTLTTGGGANPNANFNDKVADIDAADPLVYTVSGEGGLRDDNHWNGSGMKSLSERMVNVMKGL